MHPLRSPFRAAPWLLAALVVLGGCSSTSTKREPSTVPVTVSATPARSATYSARVQATISVANGDGLVAVDGALWVKTDDGRVVRIDPATNRVTREIRLDTVSDPSKYCQGIGTDGTSVWACATSDDSTGIAQIDPNSGRAVRRVPVGKVFDQLALPATARGIWILTADGNSVSVVDPATGRKTAYALDVRCLQLAAKDDRVVATAATADAVIILDAATGSVIGQVALHAPRVVAMTGSDIWIDTADGLTRLARDLSVRAVYRGLIAGPGGDLVAAVGSVWVRAGNGAITRIDPVGGRLGELITPERPLSGGSLVVAFGSIWTTSGDDGTVVRLSLEA